MGKNSGPRGSPEKASQQALCRGTAAARLVHVRQEEYRYCIWTGWFPIHNAISLKWAGEKKVTAGQSALITKLELKQ